MPNDLDLSVLSQLITYLRVRDEPWFDQQEREAARDSLPNDEAKAIFDVLMGGPTNERFDAIVQSVRAYAGPI